jgi:hypothetical protein
MDRAARTEQLFCNNRLTFLLYRWLMYAFACN